MDVFDGHAASGGGSSGGGGEGAGPACDDWDGSDGEMGIRPQSPASAARERWELLPREERLSQVLAYLRQQHRHCIYCGCQVREWSVSAIFSLGFCVQCPLLLRLPVLRSHAAAPASDRVCATKLSLVASSSLPIHLMTRTTGPRPFVRGSVCKRGGAVPGVPGADGRGPRRVRRTQKEDGGHQAEWRGRRERPSKAAEAGVVAIASDVLLG